MIRFILSIIIYTFVTQWIYSEIKIISPRMVPKIDTVLYKFQIPTHDRWGALAGDLSSNGYIEAGKYLQSNKGFEADQNLRSVQSEQNVPQEYPRNSSNERNYRDRRNYSSGEFGNNEFQIRNEFF